MTLTSLPRDFRSLLISCSIVVACAPSASGDVLVRWDQDQIPSPQSLGISTIVLPGSNTAVLRDALAQGYRVLLEVEASDLARFKAPPEGVVGLVSSGELPAGATLSPGKSKPGSLRVIEIDDRGKWPHIRTNWVTKNKDILQVTSRSAQPWIESNAALLRMTRATAPGPRALLTYPWKPITLADKDEGPALENYLVAIAETGSFGGDLLLPLHPEFQKRLLLGHPQTRLEWNEMRRYIEFFSWNLPDRYEPVANIKVVTAEPAASFEVMNLLLRHNLPFELVAPGALTAGRLESTDLLLVPDPIKSPELAAAAAFAREGGILVVAQPAGDLPWRAAAPVTKTADRAAYQFEKGRVVELLTPIANPDAFALDLRQLLGPDRRVIDVWNGITVLAAPFSSPDGNSLLVTALNYAHEALAVQVRVRGTFSVVHYESPEEPVSLLPYQHREGFTEFVIPNLKVAGRVFLAR